MIPVLFDAKATTFTTNGIGRLSYACSCVVVEERNGPYTLTMKYPINGIYFADIKHSNIIVAKPFQNGRLQPFRIYHISRPMNGIVVVDAEHISYQLNHIPVSPFSAQGVQNAMNGFKTNAAEACPFTFWTDLTSTSSFAVPEPSAIRSYLGGRDGSIIDVYGNGAEYEWDEYTVKLHSSRGKDNGVTLRYGKNLLDLKQEENIENTYTGIYPYWTSTEGQLITLPEKVLHSANASNFPYQRTIPYDFSDAFDNAPTVAQLREYANRFMVKNNIGVPNVSIDVEFINLSDTVEYRDTFKALQTVNLCDIVTVEFEKLGVSTKAKVSRTEWDVLNERYNSITIGDRQSSLSKTIEDQMEKVDEAPTASQVQANIDRATGVLGAGLRGHVVINRNADGYANEILFLDTENLYTARNVLRINMNGIGFSSTGYTGPYYQSWTIDGHFALGGNNNSYGDFEILDGSGKKLGEWNKDGLRFFDSAQKLLLAINHGGMYLYDTTGKTLAQLTSRGLNVYEGSIEGGTIKIGENFSVDRNGKMKATSAEFTGDIKGGTIKIGKNFSVDNEGKMKATSAQFTGAVKSSEITGGTININNRFKVNKDGNLNARFNGGTIEIGKNFKVDANGKMKATSASFSGDVTGSKITGSTFSGAGGKFTVDENGKMTARGGTFNGGEIIINGERDKLFWTGFDEEGTQEVHIGGFKVWEYGEGAYLGSDDKEVFIGDNEDMCFVTGWDGETYAHGDPEENLDNSNFGVVIDSNNVYAQEVYINNSIFDDDHYWGVGESIDDLYRSSSHGVYTLQSKASSLDSRVTRLEQLISNLSGGGGS